MGFDVLEREHNVFRGFVGVIMVNNSRIHSRSVDQRCIFATAYAVSLQLNLNILFLL